MRGLASLGDPFERSLTQSLTVRNLGSGSKAAVESLVRSDKQKDSLTTQEKMTMGAKWRTSALFKC